MRTQSSKPFPKIDTSILYNIAFDHFPIQRRNALEIGCGDGEFAYKLCEYFDNVVAIDIDNSLIEKAKGKWSRSNLTFLTLNAEEINNRFGETRFDFILSILTLHHCDLDIIIPSLKKLLAEGGRLVIIDLYIKRCNSLVAYFVNQILEYVRIWQILVKSMRNLGILAVLKFQIDLFTNSLTRTGREHIGDDLLLGRPYPLQEWKYKLRQYIPNSKECIIIPGIMMFIGSY